MSVAPISFQGSFAFVGLSLCVSLNTTCKGSAHQAEEESQSQTQQPFFKVATI